MLLAQSDAADRQVEILRLVTFADDEQCAAANVHDEVRAFCRVGVMRDAEVYEPCFLDTGDLPQRAEPLWRRQAASLRARRNVFVRRHEPDEPMSRKR
jgi:hypothetical protein